MQGDVDAVVDFGTPVVHPPSRPTTYESGKTPHTEKGKAERSSSTKKAAKEKKKSKKEEKSKTDIFSTSI